MTTRPVLFKGQQYVMGVLTIAALTGAVIVIMDSNFVVASLLMAVGLVMGVLLVLPVGGADVPIVISLLNALTGLAVAASGLVLDNTLLLVAGTLVGASGTILTRAMASAMGRSVNNIIFGAFKGGSTAGSTEVSDRPVKSGSAEDVAILLGYAQRVIVVPGYGLAVAQAQHTMYELTKALEEKGIEVVFGIHPVAGRMPGHMNVLLAEANVPYEVLQEMDEVNPQFKTADVCLVVGANDVVNPAAKSTPGSPIYGMPILNAGDAQQVVFLKRSMRPGFAGIENELLYEPNTTLLFGDAKDSLTKVLGAVKGSPRGCLVAIYAVVYHYADKPDLIAEHRPAHREYIATLLGDGGLIASGRTEGGVEPSALLLFEADSVADVEAVLDPDPFWTQGLIDKRDIREWILSSGSLGLDSEH